MDQKAGAWCSGLALLAVNQKVAGSNPAVPDPSYF